MRELAPQAVAKHPAQFCNERQCEAQPSAYGLLKRWPVRADGIGQAVAL